MNQTSESNAQLLEKSYRTSAIVIILQILTMLVLTVVAWFVVAYPSVEVSEQTSTALWVAILFIAVASFVLRRMWFSWERLKNVALLRGISGLFSSLTTNTILLASFGELIAIMGFLVATLSGDKFEMFRAAAISLIVFLINFPRKSIWKKVLAGAEKL